MLYAIPCIPFLTNLLSLKSQDRLSLSWLSRLPTLSLSLFLPSSFLLSLFSQYGLKMEATSKSFFGKNIPCVWNFNSVFVRNSGACKYSNFRLPLKGGSSSVLQTCAHSCKQRNPSIFGNLQRAFFGKNSEEVAHTDVCVRHFLLSEKYPMRSMSKWTDLHRP